MSGDSGVVDWFCLAARVDWDYLLNSGVRVWADCSEPNGHLSAGLRCLNGRGGF